MIAGQVCFVVCRVICVFFSSSTDGFLRNKQEEKLKLSFQILRVGEE